MGRRFLGQLLPVTVVLVTELMSYPAAAASTQNVRDAIPGHIEVHPVLRPFVDHMWQRSPTFRRQCRRLAAERHVRVRLLLDDLPGRSLDFHARAILRSQDGALASADVHLKPSPEAIELIAHEFEHILEQFDGIDLQAQAGTGAVWNSGDDSLETRRAIETGRRVAREVTMGVDITTSRDDPRVGTRHLLTMKQRDRDTRPSSRPSARVSGTGRQAAFVSLVQLVETDRNQLPDIYVLDLVTGHLTLESVGAGSTPANGWSANPDISGDGRYVVFESVAGNLTDPTFPPGGTQVFLRDREQGTTRMLTLNQDDQPANGASRHAAISADGAVVVFESDSTDLLHTGEVTHGSVGIYLLRLASGRLSRVDVAAGGEPHGEQSMSPSVSADGRVVAFASRANLLCHRSLRCAALRPSSHGATSIYVRDMDTDDITRISDSDNGGHSDGPSYHPSISADARHVAFVSEASNLIRGATGRTAQTYVHDRSTGATELVSRRPDGRPADGPNRFPAISGDGSHVAFQSVASNLVCMKRCAVGDRDSNLVWDVFVLDRTSGAITRASRHEGGEEWMAPSRGPSLDHAGRVLAFSSRHPLDETDAEHDDDLYIWTRR